MTGHAPSARASGWGYKAACTCQWTGRRIHSTESAALVAAVAHGAKRKLEEQRRACGKVAFPNREVADAAVLKAKILHSLRGKAKRREQRTYFCIPCAAWHLTSQADTQAEAS